MKCHKSTIYEHFRTHRILTKSQTGMNAAMLVAILAALIIIYIIFLPSEDRLKIVGENDTNGDSSDSNAEILVEDKEVIMEVVSQDEVEHDLPSVNLYTSTEANVVKEENSIYVKNGLFDKQEKELNFKLKDADNTKNVLISFDAKKSQGRLMIIVNNYEVYNNKIDKVNVEPIKVPNENIAASNDVKISVSGVGIAFWATNEYLLENFKITADVTDTSTRESELKFIVPQSESSNVEKAKLRFVPECQPDNVGTLDILMNNHIIYSSVPDCGSPRPLEFSPMHLITGENKLVFRTDKGRYLIDQIKVTNQLKEQPSYTYFFDIEKNDLKKIEKDEKIVNLTISFTDDQQDKEAEIIVNGRKTFMTRHHEFEWNLNLNRFIEEGSNSLKIVPEERLEIRKLIVRLEDKN